MATKMLTHFVVLYVIIDEGILPQAFLCQAEDADHAEEQCMDAYPDADVVWVYEGESPQSAYLEYWEEAAT